MTLMPKRTKYRKQQKGQMAGLSKGATFVDFGEFGMQVLLERLLLQKEYVQGEQLLPNDLPHPFLYPYELPQAFW